MFEQSTYLSAWLFFVAGYSYKGNGYVYKKSNKKTSIKRNQDFISFMNSHKDIKEKYRLGLFYSKELSQEAILPSTSYEFSCDVELESLNKLGGGDSSQPLYAVSSKEDIAYKRNMLFYTDETLLPRPPFFVDKDTWALSWSKILEYGLNRYEKRDIKKVVSRMTLDKSPGPTLSANYGNKRHVLSTEYGWRLFNHFKKLMLTPNGCVAVFGGNNKDELRLVEKVQQDKTRLFLVSDIFLCMFGNLYLQDMNEKLSGSQGINPPNYVGLQIYGGGWNTLINSMKKYKYFHGTDFGKFDKAFDSLILWELARIKIHWLQSSDRTDFMAITNYYNNVINSWVLLPGGEVCQKHRGNPSGTITTTVDNTLYHMFIVNFAYIHLYNAYPQDNLFYGVYSDDGIMAYDDLKFRDDYQNFLKSFQVETEFDFPTKIEDLQFLGHKSFFDAQTSFYYPILSSERLFCSLAYKINECLNPMTIMQKIAALKQEGFYNKEFVDVINDYGLSVYNRFNVLYKNNSKWQGSWKAFCDDNRIRKLYRGY